MREGLGEGNTHARKRKRRSPASFSIESPGKRKALRDSVLRGGQRDAERFTAALLEAFVQNAWSFTVFDSAKKSNNFYAALDLVVPWYTREFWPSRHTFTGRHLDNLYDKVLCRVTSRLDAALADGYGTLIFDGWADSTSASVVNVLLRVEGPSDSTVLGTRRTFFLESFFTSYEKVDADAYVRLVEAAMEKFGGMGRICAVTSDSARCCQNARDSLTAKYPRLVGVQDQAHVANLLMQDVGRLGWVKTVLDRITAVTTETKQKVKLRAALANAVKEHN